MFILIFPRRKRSTPVKSTKSEEITSPLGSARKLAKDHHPTTTFTSTSTLSSHQPSSSAEAASSTLSKKTRKPWQPKTRSRVHSPREQGLPQSQDQRSIKRVRTCEQILPPPQKKKLLYCGYCHKGQKIVCHSMLAVQNA